MSEPDLRLRLGKHTGVLILFFLSKTHPLQFYYILYSVMVGGADVLP